MPYCTPRRPPNNNHLPLPPVYLVQGLLGLSRLAVFTFFKDDLALDPASVGFLTGLGFAPWVIKPLYGFLSDTVPLFGYRRRSYLILCGILGARPGGGMQGGLCVTLHARQLRRSAAAGGCERAAGRPPHAQVYSRPRPRPRGGCTLTRSAGATYSLAPWPPPLTAGTASWTLLATAAGSPSAAVAFLILGSAATACADVVADSIVVELSRGEPQASAGDAGGGPGGWLH